MARLAKVVVIGAGNAGLCAALSAREAGAQVTVLERAPLADRGGNTAFVGGGFRFAYRDGEDIKALVPDLSPVQLEETDFASYAERRFFDDIARLTDNRSDPDLLATMVKRSYATVKWMRGRGIRWIPMYGRQAYKGADGRFLFFGGLTLEVVGAGLGLLDFLHRAVNRDGIEIRYETRAKSLVGDARRGVTGVIATTADGPVRIAADAVILASGGFQSNPEWRARYLGPGWDLAKVRGTAFNTGDGIRMAIDIGAAPHGHWSGCHAVEWDLNAPPYGDRAIGDQFQKHSYPLGIMVNAQGRRFFDEGADFRNFTYAELGRQILAQPNMFAWQVFDAKMIPKLRDEYRIRQVTKVIATSLEDLARKLDGVDPAQFLRTVKEYNAAVKTNVPLDLNKKDGRGTEGLAIPKSNWATTIDEPPYEAYATTCGITFTYGGLRIDPFGRVISEDGNVIPGLFGCGELMGGMFYFGYGSGSGLTMGAVFGRIAGQSAAGRIPEPVGSLSDN
jgi:tricarballylate dehydrogenase